jgi:hypothetical protein
MCFLNRSDETKLLNDESKDMTSNYKNILGLSMIELHFIWQSFMLVWEID